MGKWKWIAITRLNASLLGEEVDLSLECNIESQGPAPSGAGEMDAKQLSSPARKEETFRTLADLLRCHYWHRTDKKGLIPKGVRRDLVRL